jgi:hypothetical protein
VNSGAEMMLSIRLFGLTAPSPKLKKVCRPIAQDGQAEGAVLMLGEHAERGQ